MEIFEDEWKKFKFMDQNEFDKALTNPLITIPLLEEQFQKRIPAVLKMPANDYESLRVYMKMFLTLRHMM